jgi:hypothetical protein
MEPIFIKQVTTVLGFATEAPQFGMPTMTSRALQPVALLPEGAAHDAWESPYNNMPYTFSIRATAENGFSRYASE